MIRSLLAVAAGYLTIMVFNSFVRIIFAVYNKSAISFSGVSELPSLPGYLIVAAGFLFGLIGGLMTNTIARKNAAIATLSLVILVIAAGFIAYDLMAENEPLWYFISSPLLKISGILTAYYIKTRETKNINQNGSAAS